MPFVEPFWRQPFGRALSLAPASALVLATVAASTIAAAFRSANLWDVPITADTGCVRYLKIPVRRMNR